MIHLGKRKKERKKEKRNDMFDLYSVLFIFV